MDYFTSDDLKRLVERTGEPIASIYMPTHRSGRDVLENSTRFKNLIKLVGDELKERFPNNQPLQTRLNEAAKLAADDDWWQHQSDGLAMFLDASRFDRYRVPLHFEEFITVGRRVHLRPMVRLLQGDGQFNILAVSQNRVRLLKGTHYNVDELNADQMPSDLRSALNIDEYTSSLQQHSTGGPTTTGTTIFHGHGSSDMDVRKQDEIRQFFHRIDAALKAFLGQEQLPLVFAGVDYLFPIFRETCNHRGLVDKPITGNPDDVSPEELHRQAWALVESQFTKQQNSAIAQFENAAGGPTAITELGDVISAARQGAIKTLLLAEGEQRWGVIDQQTGQIENVNMHTADAEDLLNYAAGSALTSGGTVYCLPQERMPKKVPVAALLRFPMPSA